MAFKCKATDNRPWLSRINGQDDGAITVGTEGGNGSFRGRHKTKQLDLEGHCFETAGNLPDRIIFWLPPTNPEYIYVGAINDAGDQVNGKRYHFTADSVEQSKLDGDEDWVGTKTTLIPVDNDER